MSIPSDDEFIAFLEEAGQPQTKKQLADAFGIKGDKRRPFKHVLRKLEKKGILEKQSGGAYALPDALPTVTVLEITGLSSDGDLEGRLADGDRNDIRIDIIPNKKMRGNAGRGDIILSRLERINDKHYKARIIRKLDNRKTRLMGLVTKTKNSYLLLPTEKKNRDDYIISETDLNNAKDGDIVLAEMIAQTKRHIRQKAVKVVDVIGNENDPKIISLISAQEQGLYTDFPDAVTHETKDMDVPPLGKRDDLRDIPLVTIDGADAKDFDDAVFAEKTDDGFHLIVAIADVAYYVRADSALDKEGLRRGNSTYFPDRVIPMLPEQLSNNLCSLRPDEDRACLAVHMWIDMEGNLTKYKFVRGLMRSKARLIYEQVQAAKDGVVDDLTKPLMDDIIQPLYDAFAVLLKNRENRHALDLDLPERQIIVDETGRMTDVKIRDRLDSHRLIEEMMILANVAAAKALENKKAPCVYRVHEKPDATKFDSIRDFISAFNISFPKGQVIKGEHINGILLQAAKKPYSHLISEVVLRSQSQAHYSVNNKGHFGLALEKYAHFTSPIRRYADLLVHRSLIQAYNLGEGGLRHDDTLAKIEEKAEHISTTERTSITAERTASDRFVAGFLSDKLGNQFEGRITGVTNAGLFIQLKQTGADTFCPIRTLPNDYYNLAEEQHALIGTRTGRLYRLGADIDVRLVEADGLSGSMIVEVIGSKSADIPGVTFKNNSVKSSRKSSGERGNSNKKGRKNSPHKGKRKNNTKKTRG